MKNIRDQFADAIDIRQMRNFDRDGFQSFNAEEIEEAADRCKELFEKSTLDFCNWKDNNYRVSAYIKEPDGSKTAYYEANDYLNNNLFTAEELLKIYLSK